jgi:hypothetical protein
LGRTRRITKRATKRGRSKADTPSFTSQLPPPSLIAKIPTTHMS